MSVVKKIRELTKAPNQKLLEKYGLIDECGQMTSEYKDVIWEKLKIAYRDEILDDLKALDAEEKKDKKK